MHYGDQLKRLEVLLSRAVNARLRAFDLTMQQQSALHAVHEHEQAGKPACQRDLEAELGLSNPTVAGICKRLEAKGLIRRERDRDDARLWRIRTTEADERLRAQMLRCIEEVEAGLTAGLTPADRARLAELLQKVETNLETMNQTEGGEEP